MSPPPPEMMLMLLLLPPLFPTCPFAVFVTAVQGLQLGLIKTSPWSDFLPTLLLLLPPVLAWGGEVWLCGCSCGSVGGPLPFWTALELTFLAGWIFMGFCKWVLITRCCSELSFICLTGMFAGIIIVYTQRRGTQWFKGDNKVQQITSFSRLVFAYNCKTVTIASAKNTETKMENVGE